MCGIVASFGLPRLETDALLERALRQLTARGPDGEDAQVLELPGLGLVGLAHTRLAIIDRSPSGRQPMSARDGKLWLVANAEIMNARELRAELERRGHRFRGRCDVETILHAYAEWGQDCQRHLRGFYSAIVVDVERGQVHVLQDASRIKPLYASRDTVRWDGVELPRWLASAPLDRLEPDPEAAAAFLLTGAHPVRLGKGDFPPPRAEARAPASPQASARAAASSAVELRELVQSTCDAWTMSDEPVAVAWSGGIDSSIVGASLARERGGHAFCVRGAGEAVGARESALRLGLEFHEVVADPAVLAEEFDDFVEALPAPTADGVNLDFVARACRNAGVRVLLVGTGADELFGGYSHVRAVRVLERTKRLAPAALRRLASAVPWTLRPRWWKLREALGASSGWATYRTLRALLPRPLVARLVPGSPASTAEFPPPPPGLVPDTLATLERSHYLPHVLLRDADSLGMRHSVEVRPPFLDPHLVAAVAAEPCWQSEGKATLIRAFRDLFPDGAPRKETFQLPLDAWLRAPGTAPLVDRARAVVDREQRDPGGVLEPRELLRLWRDFRAGAPFVSATAMWGVLVLAHWLRRA